MRIPAILIALLALAIFGCTSEPVASVAVGPKTELVALKLSFEEAFPDTDGAKRIVICQLKDERKQKEYVGEGCVGGGSGVSKFVMRDDPTLVLPRLLAAKFKKIGFNVALGERIPEVVGGEAIRDTLKRYNADYLVSGKLDEFYLRGLCDSKQTVIETVTLRWDIYNKDGQLRMYYPEKVSDTESFSAMAVDSAGLSDYLDRSIETMLAGGFEDPYFVRQFDLEVDAVKELMKSKPAEMKPEEIKPLEIKPEEKPVETKPIETKPVETPKVETEPKVESGPKMEEAKPAEPKVETGPKLEQTPPAEPKPDAAPKVEEPKKEGADAGGTKGVEVVRDLEDAVKNSQRP